MDGVLKGFTDFFGVTSGGGQVSLIDPAQKSSKDIENLKKINEMKALSRSQVEDLKSIDPRTIRLLCKLQILEENENIYYIDVKNSKLESLTESPEFGYSVSSYISYVAKDFAPEFPEYNLKLILEREFNDGVNQSLSDKKTLDLEEDKFIERDKAQKLIDMLKIILKSESKMKTGETTMTWLSCNGRSSSSCDVADLKAKVIKADPKGDFFIQTPPKDSDLDGL